MFTTNPITLKVLIDEVTEGKIQLPDFQRGWVWDDERIKDLLVSNFSRISGGGHYDPGCGW